MLKPRDWLHRLSPTRAAVAETRARDLEVVANRYRGHLEFITDAVAAMATGNDLLTATTDDAGTSGTHYTGNPYNHYSRKVTQLTRMYEGMADWGCDICQQVVDVRSAFIIGPGPRPVRNPALPDAVTGERELGWLSTFLAANRIDHGRVISWCRQAELEGKALVALEVRNGEVRANYRSWVTWPYEVGVEQDDFDTAIRARYIGHASPDTDAIGLFGHAGGLSEPFDLDAAHFVYRRFGGSYRQVNYPPAKAASVIRDMQDLDKAIWDWRKINHLYASPTPYFRFEDADTATDFMNSVEYKNWRIGKGIAIGGAGAEFDLICYKGEGYTTLKDEITYHARKISGATSVPVHFFGFPDLLSNRDTADNMIEAMEMGARESKAEWVSLFTELYRKAMELANAGTNSPGLRPEAVVAEIPELTSAHMTWLKEVWIPSYVAGGIPDAVLLSKLGVADAEKVAENMKAEKQEEAKANAAVLESRNSGNGGQRTARDGGRGSA